MLAPTVPSAPSPQNLQAVVPAGAESKWSPVSRDRLVTSSIIPIVNLFLVSLSNTALICEGVVSLEPKPYLPVNTGVVSNLVPFKAATTSKYRGSPIEPGSLVLSSTEIFLTVSGIASTSLSALKGLYSLTLTKPNLAPLAFR